MVAAATGPRRLRLAPCLIALLLIRGGDDPAGLRAFLGGGDRTHVGPIGGGDLEDRTLNRDAPS